MTNGIMENGYARIMVGRKSYLAHRMMYALLHGWIPRSMNVTHACDNRACVNPMHLSAGALSANMMDMAEKERGNTRKLTAAQVRTIRARSAAGERSKSLAAEFGVTTQNVKAICQGKTWKHLREQEGKL